MTLRQLAIVGIALLLVVGYFVVDGLIVTDTKRIEALVRDATEAVDRREAEAVASMFSRRFTDEGHRDEFAELVRLQIASLGLGGVRLNRIAKPEFDDMGHTATVVAHFRAETQEFSAPVTVVLEVAKEDGQWRFVKAEGYPFGQHTSGFTRYVFPPQP